MFFKKQKFLVAGISRSGVASADFLLKRGAKVFLFDDVDSESVHNAMRELESRGGVIVPQDGLEQASLDCDILVLSPGIPIDHPLPVSFKKQGKRIMGESELDALYLRATAVAVTGTNGKTTTVSELTEILNASGFAAVACGNVGTPVLSKVEELGYDDIAVVEVSSFQLETLVSFRPHIAVVTNIAEDHLDRHYNMENYIFLKERILKNATPSEYAVLNYDDPTVRSFAQHTKAQIVWCSMEERVDGAYYEEGSLFFRGEKIVEADELAVRGRHNLYNTLFCIACASLLGVDGETLRKAATEFKGIRHRMEYVREVNGIKYINDSKATNVNATLRAVESLKEESVLLLGGRDKGESYDFLFEELKKSGVVHTVLYGENRMKLLKSAMNVGYEQITVCATLEIALAIANQTAQEGQTVLLSPAAASFDAFSSFEDRGDRFVSLVNAL